MLDYFLLIAVILVVLALLLFLFFWNQFVGYVLTLTFRVAYWNQGGSSIWIEIGALILAIYA